MLNDLKEKVQSEEFKAELLKAGREVAVTVVTALTVKLVVIGVGLVVETVKDRIAQNNTLSN